MDWPVIDPLAQRDLEDQRLRRIANIQRRDPNNPHINPFGPENRVVQLHDGPFSVTNLARIRHGDAYDYFVDPVTAWRDMYPNLTPSELRNLFPSRETRNLGERYRQNVSMIRNLPSREPPSKIFIQNPPGLRKAQVVSRRNTSPEQFTEHLYYLSRYYTGEDWSKPEHPWRDEFMTLWDRAFGLSQGGSSGSRLVDILSFFFRLGYRIDIIQNGLEFGDALYYELLHDKYPDALVKVARLTSERFHEVIVKGVAKLYMKADPSDYI
jgi:hypothetical protein